MDPIFYCTEFFCRIFLDLSKAFDSINHEHLKKNLNDLGLSESAIENIHTFKNNRQQKTLVKTKNTESNWMSLHQGVPQGTIFEPLIFRLYINDLNKNLTESCKVVQYADDTLLFCVDMISKMLCYCKTALQLSEFFCVLHESFSKTQHKET